MAKTKVKILQPSYYNKFHCIGSACEDDCCHGWTINIDKKTYYRYRNLRGSSIDFATHIKRYGKDMRNDETYAHFVLEHEEKRCPFMNDKGLCRIQLEHGHQYLSKVCQMYPRVSSVVLKDILELSFYMTCPEVVRVALFNPEPTTFQLNEVELDENDIVLRNYARRPLPEGKAGSLAAHIWPMREACIDILQHRDLALAERIYVIGMLLNKLTKLEKEGFMEQVPSVIGAYKGMTLNGEFNGIMDNLAGNENIQAGMKSLLFDVAVNYSKDPARENNLFRIFYTLIANNAPQLEKAKVEAVKSLQEGDADEINVQMDLTYSDMQAIVEASAEKYWRPFLEEKGYILENYFVNYVFASLFPMSFRDYLDVYHHTIVLAEQYALIRMLICVFAPVEKGISDKLLIRILTVMAKMLQHNQLPANITRAYELGECDSLAHIAFLLKE